MRNLGLMAIALGVGLLAAAFAVPALAQDAAPAAGGVIDFTPLMNDVLTAVAAALGAVAIYLLTLARAWLKAKTGVELQISDEKMREIIDSAISYGIAVVVGAIGDRAKLTVSNAQIAQIANYVIAAVPGALKNFGITPERLQDMIRARIIAWTDGPAAPLQAEPIAPAAPAT